jgi:hypothetical protein
MAHQYPFTARLIEEFTFPRNVSRWRLSPQICFQRAMQLRFVAAPPQREKKNNADGQGRDEQRVAVQNDGDGGGRVGVVVLAAGVCHGQADHVKK